MLDNVLQQLRAAGLVVDHIEVDSPSIVRVKTEGDTGAKRSGWYRVYSVISEKGNTYYVGSYGNWKADIKAKIQYDDSQLTKADKEAFKAKQALAEKARALEVQQKAKEAAKRANELWPTFTRTGGNTPYLTKKQVSAFGVKLSRDAVVVPVVGIDGDLKGLQFIQADGSKMFLTGTAKKGAFHLIGEVKDNVPLVVVEGYSTGASVHQATGWPVVIAFDAGNLPSVAKVISDKYPKAKLVMGADNDAAGLKYAGFALDKCQGVMAVPAFAGGGGEGLTDFNDLHTSEGLEVVKQQLEQALKQGKKSKPKKPKKLANNRFFLGDKGLFYVDHEEDRKLFVCAKLEILASGRSHAGDSWGLLVGFSDRDGTAKEWFIPYSLFAVDGGSKIIQGLLDKGLEISHNRNAKKQLLEYMQQEQPEEKVRLVNKLGWHGDAFLLPYGQIGEPEENLYYCNDKRSVNHANIEGTLEAWRDNIAKYCQGNPLLMFSVSAAFAAPLLTLCNLETFGFHIVGDSSLGKSTISKVAASVIGSPKYFRTWHATSTALETIASEHSDCLLILDEISQADPLTIGNTVYMLGNEQGRARGTDTGANMRSQHFWRLLFLSTGEKLLDEHMANANKKSQAGMAVRLLSLPACSHNETEKRKVLGVFDDLHGFEHGADLSEHLKQQSAVSYGAAFEAFIHYLVMLSDRHRKQLVERLHNASGDFEQELLSVNAGGQARRAARRFAIVGLAGELATKQGLTSWAKGEALAASKAMYKRWLSFRGGEGSAEDKALLEHLVLQLQSKAESHFTRWDKSEDEPVVDTHQPKTMERWGFRRVSTIDKGMAAAIDGQHSLEIFYIYKEAFKHKLCAGHSHSRALELLDEHKALTVSKGRGKCYRMRVPGGGDDLIDVYQVSLESLLANRNP